MDELWSHALELADAQLEEYVNRLPRNLPTRAALSFDVIISKEVDWDSVIRGLGTQ
jgi:hypothetical protein